MKVSIRSYAVSTLALAMLATACRQEKPPLPMPPAPAEPVATAAPAPATQVPSTFIGGEAVVPQRPQSVQFVPKSGDIRLNFPSASVQVVARAVLGDLLNVPYMIAPDATATVSVVTPGPIARSSLIAFLEESLKASNLALVSQNGGYLITSTGQARNAGPVGANAVGYGNEILTMKFVSAEEMRRLLDPVLPGIITATDATRNTLAISGTTGQRASARALLEQFDVNWLRNMSFAMFVPQRTDGRLIVPELEKLINAPDAPTRGLVRLISMEKLNGILAISAQRQYLDDVQRWIEILDREGESNGRRLFVYRVQNGRSRDLARTLNAAFGNSTNSLADKNNDPFAPKQPEPARREPEVARSELTPPASAADNGKQASGDTITATISSDETNNAIIVFGSAREYAVIEDALRKLDVMPFQVMIEAAITEVSLTNDLKYGVQWNFQAGTSNFALADGTAASPLRAFPGFSYFYSNNNDISATLNALAKRTNVKVVSAPKLMVLNNQTAALQVGDQVPISTQSSVSVTNAGSPIVNSIEYRDTGVILKVTPRVNGSGLVLLDIAQEVSDVAQNNVSGIDSPTISTRRIATSVAVQDGQVIALGGLFRDSKSLGKNGIPLLSRIPVLGSFLFGNRADLERRTELLVLIKPHVLRTFDDARSITEELRAKIRSLEPFRTEGKIP